MQTREPTKARPSWRLQQLHLGFSPQRTLCVLPRPPPSDAPEKPAKCFISALPDELLAQVLDFVSPPACSYRRGEYEKSLRYLFVCRRWRRIYETFVYQFPDLGPCGWRKSCYAFRLLRTLRLRSDLRERVIKFNIETSASYEKNTNYAAIVELIQSCQLSLQEIHLHASWEESALWKIIHCFKDCPRLHTLRLSTSSDACGLETVLNHCDIPSLRTLSLSRYGGCAGKSPGAPWPSTWHSTSESSFWRLSSLLTDRCGAGTITTLELRDPSVYAYITELFIQWPARLVNFNLTMLTHSEHSQQYTVHAAQKMLGYHKESLENVELGILMRDVDSTHFMPDFSQFPRLRTLRLSSYNLLKEKPVVAAAKLTGGVSTLKHLGISFGTEDQHPESTSDFGPEQVQWFKDFVAPMTMGGTASDGKPYQKLDTIYVQFEPEHYIPRFDSYTPPPMDKTDLPAWPWEHVDQTARALTRLGVKMTYTLVFTKREWFRSVKREWRRERRQLAKDRAAINLKTRATRTVLDREIGTSPPPKPPRGIELYFKRVEN